MRLKSVAQLTNIAWIIGGVSAVSGGYSYINSRKDKINLVYSQKKLEKIKTLDDIEDFEAEKGCRFVYYARPDNQKPDWVPKYNDWLNGGVLAARDYVSRSEEKNKEELEKELIKITDEAKGECKRNEIIYKEIGKDKKKAK